MKNQTNGIIKANIESVSISCVSTFLFAFILAAQGKCVQGQLPAPEGLSTNSIPVRALGSLSTFADKLKAGDLVQQMGSPQTKALYNAYDFVFCKALKLACFTAGTPIETESGPKAIETIQPGDLVWCRDDDDPSAPLQLKPVEQVFERWARVLEVNLPGGVSIGTTAEHPFWVVGKGWVWAGDLVPGDHLLGEDGQEVAVESITQTEQFEKVYNLRVADNHTYFVGSDGWGFSVWVHNSYNPVALSKSAAMIDRGGLTFAGRSLVKHSARPSSPIPVVKGNPISINIQAQKLVDSILFDSSSIFSTQIHARYGSIIEVYNQSKTMGLRFKTTGLFLHFLGV